MRKIETKLSTNRTALNAPVKSPAVIDPPSPLPLRQSGSAASLRGEGRGEGWILGSLTCAIILLVHTGLAADFSVSTPGGAYAWTINGSQNPTLTLVQGKTYTFAVNSSSFHPFYINSPGVQNNNITQGTVTYTVPMGTSEFSYYCSYHYFGAQILTVPAAPPPPPTIELLSLNVGSNLVFRSTGTNTWSLKPQFSTNLHSTNWFALTVLTNRFLSGTNETICGRPPGDQVFIRIQSTPN